MSIWIQKLVAHKMAWGLKTLHCESCKKRFHYEIARRGQGDATMVLFMDREGARERALGAASADAERLLQSSQDPVPCPYCGRIQEAAIREMARSQVRWAWPFIILFALISIVVPVAMSFIQPPPGEAPPTPRVKHPELFVGSIGVGVSLALGAICWGFIYRMDRDRFEKLPTNHWLRVAPPALIETSDPGLLVPARPIELIHKGDWLILQLHRIGLPACCVNCAARTYISFQPPIKLSPEQETFPCCLECQRILARRWWRTSFKVFGVFVLIGCVLPFVAPRPQWVTYLISSLAGVPLSLVLAILLPNVVGVSLTRRGYASTRGWSAIHTASNAYRHLIEQRYVEADAYKLRLDPTKPEKQMFQSFEK